MLFHAHFEKNNNAGRTIAQYPDLKTLKEYQMRQNLPRSDRNNATMLREEINISDSKRRLGILQIMLFNLFHHVSKLMKDLSYL